MNSSSRLYVMSNPFDIQFIRFLLIGCLNTGFSYTIYAILLYFGLEYVTANFGALLLGIIFSFRTQGRLVFRNKNTKLFVRFAAFWCLIFLLNILFISLFLKTGLNAYWAGAFALVPSTVASYFVQKVLVFGPSSTTSPVKSTR